MVNDKDMTDQFDTDDLMYESIKLYPPMTDFTTTSAVSTIKNMYALLSPTPIFTHSPTPQGLPGGYPIHLSQEGAEVVLPEGITLEEAIKINEDSAKLDGIERIDDNGTVVFADYAHEILKDMIGFDRKSFKPEESHEVALEMMGLYKEYFSKLKAEDRVEA